MCGRGLICLCVAIFVYMCIDLAMQTIDLCILSDKYYSIIYKFILQHISINFSDCKIELSVIDFIVVLVQVRC